MKKIITCFLLCFLSIGSLIAQVPSYVPTSGLVGWWPFNGNANDESRKDNFLFSTNHDRNTDNRKLNKILYVNQIVSSNKKNSQDSLGDFSGRGVISKLIARGYDWKRRRTNAGPYVSDSGIYLKNIVL